jgi:hypothetical protein
MKTWDAIVIGSGPGGSIAALECAEAGLETLMMEESYVNSRIESHHTFEEVLENYRSAGLTAAVGKPTISYVDSVAIGGGSHVNSGIYHRPPRHIMEQVGGYLGAKRDSFEEILLLNENQISVNISSVDLISSRLLESAKKLGVRAECAKTWITESIDIEEGISRQKFARITMQKSIHLLFKKLGGTINTGIKVVEITKKNKSWQLICEETHSKKQLYFQSHKLFLGAGAIETPRLLRRSSLIPGRSVFVRAHPMIKVAYKFPDVVSHENNRVPTFQTTEFLPRSVIGCSLPTLSQMLLWCGPKVFRSLLQENLSQWALLYTLIAPESKIILSLFSSRIFFPLFLMNSQDRKFFLEQIKMMDRLAREAGAVSRLTPIGKLQGEFTDLKFKNSNESGDEQTILRNAGVSTLHLYGSCPIGMDPKKSLVSPSGEVWGQSNLVVVDSSVIPGAIGVNPQGTVMALSRLITRNFLGKL